MLTRGTIWLRHYAPSTDRRTLVQPFDMSRITFRAMRVVGLADEGQRLNQLFCWA